MMIGFHYAAELIGMQMMSPLPPLYVERPVRRVERTRADTQDAVGSLDGGRGGAQVEGADADRHLPDHRGLLGVLGPPAAARRPLLQVHPQAAPRVPGASRAAGVGHCERRPGPTWARRRRVGRAPWMQAPFGIVGEYAHPLEILILGFGTGLGPLLFARDLHLFTLWFYMTARLWQVRRGHDPRIAATLPGSSSHARTERPGLPSRTVARWWMPTRATTFRGACTTFCPSGRVRRGTIAGQWSWESVLTRLPCGAPHPSSPRRRLPRPPPHGL